MKKQDLLILLFLRLFFKEDIYRARIGMDGQAARAALTVFLAVFVGGMEINPGEIWYRIRRLLHL